MEFTPEELATEEWRDIENLFYKYKVSNLGRILIPPYESKIRNITGQISYPETISLGDKKGKIKLFNKNRKQVQHSVRMLVAKAFLPPSPFRNTFNIDRNLKNNRVANLRKSQPACLTQSVSVYSSEGKFISKFDSATQAANYLNCSVGRISSCISGNISRTVKGFYITTGEQPSLKKDIYRYRGSFTVKTEQQRMNYQVYKAARENKQIALNLVVDLENEVWVPIDGTSSFISNKGRVKYQFQTQHVTRTKLHKIFIQNKKAYFRIQSRQSNVLLEQLVATNFVPNTNNLRFLRHKDNNIFNCASDNLEWVNYLPATETSKIRCYDIDGKFINKYDRCSQAYKLLGLSSSEVSDSITSNGARTAKGYRFTWADIKSPIVKYGTKIPIKLINKNNLENILTFPSVSKAAEFFGERPGSLSQVKDKPNRSYRNYIVQSISKAVVHIEQIKQFFVSKKWPYSTSGKEQNTKAIVELLQQHNIAESSFLSMPNTGRELQHFREAGLLHLPTSIGIERDKDLFRSITLAFRRLFPGLRIEKDDINDYVLRTNEQFDLAHLDYCGPLIKSGLQSLDTLVKKDTLTFITVQDQQYFLNRWKGKNPGVKNLIPIEEIQNNYSIIYENRYQGINKVPMITLGVTK